MQVEYDSRYGVKADVYSLGVVLHVMLTCKFPKTQLNQPAIIDDSIQGGGEKEGRECHILLNALRRMMAMGLIVVAAAAEVAAALW